LTTSFQDTRIEDLKLPMFCISTNLSTRRQTIHLSGSVWSAIRASVALPPFLPPVVSDEGIETNKHTGKETKSERERYSCFLF